MSDFLGSLIVGKKRVIANSNITEIFVFQNIAYRRSFFRFGVDHTHQQADNVKSYLLADVIAMPSRSSGGPAL